MQQTEGQSPVGQWIARLLPESSDAKHKKMLANLSSPDPDLRREGILALRKSSIRDLPATREVLVIMARGDVDPQVRGAALESLGLADPHHEKMPAVLDAALKDTSPLVRRQGVIILARRNDPADMEPLLDRLASDDDPVVRGVAAEALGNVPNRKVLRALIDRLKDEFSVAYQARGSLRKLTGQNFEYDIARWQNWLSATAEPFAATGR